MKGYIRPFILQPLEWQDENVLVGCRRCPNSWYQIQSMMKNGPRINSAMRQYDYCDECITDSEKEEQSSFEELLESRYGKKSNT